MIDIHIVNESRPEGGGLSPGFEIPHGNRHENYPIHVRRRNPFNSPVTFPDASSKSYLHSNSATAHLLPLSKVSNTLCIAKSDCPMGGGCSSVSSAHSQLRNERQLRSGQSIILRSASKTLPQLKQTLFTSYTPRLPCGTSVACTSYVNISQSANLASESRPASSS